MFSTGSVAVDVFGEWSTGVEDMFVVQPCNSIFRKVLVSEELSWGEFKNRNFSSIVIGYRHSGESYTTGFFGFNILISRSVLHAGCLRSLFFNVFIFFFSFFFRTYLFYDKCLFTFHLKARNSLRF